MQKLFFNIKGEIVPVQVKKLTLEKDENMRETASITDMNKLPSVFKKDGVVTAGIFIIFSAFPTFFMLI